MLAVVVGALCAGGGAYAQSISRSDGQSASSAGRTTDLLPGRNRARMHPGNPLVIVGVEQGDNDIRSRTPVLAQSDRAATFVNPDENYRRTLAMYDQGASFHDPLLGRTQTKAYIPRHGASDPAPAPSSAAAELGEDSNKSRLWRTLDVLLRGWPWLAGAIFSMVVGALFLKRFGLSVLKPGTS
jgi:hypothetical protein